MRLKNLLLAISMAAPQIVLASGPWTNEPAGSHKFLDCPMNSLGECGLKDGYSSAQFTTDATAPISPSGVMKSTLRAGANSGGVEVHYYTPQVNRELFVGLMWRTNPQFQGRTVGNKLFFIRGPKVNGVFNFNDAILVNGQGQLIWGANTQGYDNSHTCSAPLGATCRPNVSSGVMTAGAWTRIEAYVKSSTTMTSRDGIIRWWINGQLAGNYTNINYAPDGLNEWVWAETWDGYVNPVPSVEWAHYVDHLYVSAPNFILSQPKILNDTIPSLAQSGKPYAAYLKVTDGYPGYMWTISGGSLPGGLVLGEKTGVISGTPTTCGLHSFTLKVTDANGSFATKTYSLNVTGTCTGTAISNQMNVGTNDRIGIRTVSGKMALKIPSSGAGKYQVRIYDLNGKEVRAYNGQSQNEIKMRLGNSIYVAKFAQGAQSSVLRFQVMN